MSERLTYEELKANEPCRGCGRPWFGGPHLPQGTNNYTAMDRAAADREEADFRRLHPDCRAGRQRMADSGVTHCVACCPPPPLSPDQLDRIAILVHRAGLR